VIARHSAPLVSVALVVACTAQIPEPSSADLGFAQQRWPEATLTELEGGRKLYVQTCAGCHNLVLPSELAPEEWVKAVETMRADEEVELSDEQARRITRYLYAASRAGRGGAP
jgi:cytochrome c5